MKVKKLIVKEIAIDPVAIKKVIDDLRIKRR